MKQSLVPNEKTVTVGPTKYFDVSRIPNQPTALPDPRPKRTILDQPHEADVPYRSQRQRRE